MNEPHLRHSHSVLSPYIAAILSFNTNFALLNQAENAGKDSPAVPNAAPYRLYRFSMMYTFKKPEHLCLRTEIEQLFTAGSSSMSVFPLRATFRKFDYPGHGPKVKVLLSVSKRRLHHAVDRVRAKRQIREAYRLQKYTLWDEMPEGMALHIAFIWLADRPMKSASVHRSMGKLLAHMANKVNIRTEARNTDATSETTAQTGPTPDRQPVAEYDSAR